MRHSLRSSRTHTVKASRGMAAMAAVLMGAGSICLLWSSSASAAGAGLGGVATIADPLGAPLPSGGSTDQFTVTLPANAACSGDTANDGFHVYSYLVPKGTDVTTLTFLGNNPPAQSFGFVHNGGVYYGPVNTAINTGQVISIPNDFEWAPLVTQDGLLSTLLANGGVWEAGLLCSNPTGTVTDNWNTEVTFTASGTDPNGFVWADSSGGSTPPPTTTPTTAPTTAPTAPGSGTTSTTAPSGILGTTTTTAAGDPSTSTTTTVVGGTVAATSTGTGSSGTGSTGTGTGGSPLAFTGAPVTKFLGAGLLAIGVALMLLGWANRRVRLARSNRSTPR
jgi:hypothetical protein